MKPCITVKIVAPYNDNPIMYKGYQLLRSQEGTTYYFIISGGLGGKYYDINNAIVRVDLASGVAYSNSNPMKYRGYNLLRGSDTGGYYFIIETIGGKYYDVNDAIKKIDFG